MKKIGKFIWIGLVILSTYLLSVVFLLTTIPDMRDEPASLIVGIPMTIVLVFLFNAFKK